MITNFNHVCTTTSSKNIIRTRSVCIPCDKKYCHLVNFDIIFKDYKFIFKQTNAAFIRYAVPMNMPKNIERQFKFYIRGIMRCMKYAINEESISVLPITTLNNIVESIIMDVSVEDLIDARGKHTLPQKLRDKIVLAVVSETI